MSNELELSPIWKALADVTRRQILDVLRQQAHNTGEICAHFPDMSRFAVMKHLAVLENVELVSVRAQGRERWYQLNVTPLQQIYERWLRPYEAHWAATLWQLKTTIEQKKGEIGMPDQALPMAVMRKLHVEQEITINASPALVFQAMTNDISAWWGAPYVMTDAPRQVILEPQVGGRLYEISHTGGAALYALVTAITPNARLELNGPIGMAGTIYSKILLQLEKQEEATLVKLTHDAVGDISEQQQMAYGVGWQDLLGTRLKAWVETGQRFGLPATNDKEAV